MAKERIVCPHCGAVQKEGSTVCDLCGSALEGSAVEEVEDAANPVEMAAPAAGRRADRPARPKQSDGAARGGFCTSCGASYPVGARFCGSCGEKIFGAIAEAEDAPENEKSGTIPVATVHESDEPKPRRAATDRELGRQVLIVVGAAVILIVALFVITAISREGGASSPTPSASSEVVAAPLSGEVKAAVDSFRGEIEQLTGEQKTAKQRELADFLVSHGRWDVAAGVQAEIATETGAEADWIRAGNLYYDWMDGVEADAKAAYAKKAIESYQNALQINPNNLDVRTDMAIAYMFDPDNSVQAIAQTNMVLEEDSLHVQANFNRGIMLLRVNRFDEAAFQFNKVMRIVGDPQNPIYQRSQSALDAIRQAGI